MLTVLLAVCVCLLLATAQADDSLPIRMESGAVVPAFDDDAATTVMWAGKEWYVIGSSGEGINPTSPANTYTLLAKSSFGDMAYRTGGATSSLGATLDPASNWYYNGSWTTAPSDYQGSTVQDYLYNWLGSSEGGATALEAGMALGRVLEAGTPAQPLWLLSADEELNILNSSKVPLGYDAGLSALDKSWWTRTASADTIHGSTKVTLIDPYGSRDSADYVHNEQAVRPAATIDLSKVVWTSVAEARRGKTLA